VDADASATGVASVDVKSVDCWQSVIRDGDE